MLIDVEKVSDRVRQLINGYLLRFGQAYVGLYQFQNAAESQDWTGYLAVVNITLNREGMRPMYLWLRNGNDVLLLLCISGYFRTNLKDVTDILTRLWTRRAGSVPTLIFAEPADATNAEQAIWRIYQALGRFTFVQPHAYRLHGFGSSMI